jgi:hypothetical protein
MGFYQRWILPRLIDLASPGASRAFGVLAQALAEPAEAAGSPVAPFVRAVNFPARFRSGCLQNTKLLKRGHAIDPATPRKSGSHETPRWRGMDSNFPVPREIGSGFEASAELGLIYRRRGGIIRVVVGLGKSIELLRRLEESS